MFTMVEWTSMPFGWVPDPYVVNSQGESFLCTPMRACHPVLVVWFGDEGLAVRKDVM